MNLSFKAVLWFLGAMLMALGPFFNTLKSWEALTLPINIGALLGIIGGVLFAWFGESKKPE